MLVPSATDAARGRRSRSVRLENTRLPEARGFCCANLRMSCHAVM